MKIKDALSPLAIQKLELIAGDPDMFEAVKTAILHSVYFDGTIRAQGIPDPQTNFALVHAARPGATNEELGAELKASLAAVQLLQQGFDELASFKRVEAPPKEKKNQAR